MAIIAVLVLSFALVVCVAALLIALADNAELRGERAQLIAEIRRRDEMARDSNAVLTGTMTGILSAHEPSRN